MNGCCKLWYLGGELIAQCLAVCGEVLHWGLAGVILDGWPGEGSKTVWKVRGAFVYMHRHLKVMKFCDIACMHDVHNRHGNKGTDITSDCKHGEIDRYGTSH